MRTKKDAEIIVQRLKQMYPVSDCSLSYEQAWQLLVAVRLSAQCTDARVNIVTKELFRKYTTVNELAAAKTEDIEQIVRTCGLGKSKARDISAAMKILHEKYNDLVPKEMEELLSLPGVGRKSANLIRGDIYKLPAIVADTHCIRISNRIGFVKSKDPLQVEKALVKVIAASESSDFCHRCVILGRAVCTARKAMCDKCNLGDICRTGLELLREKKV